MHVAKRVQDLLYPQQSQQHGHTAGYEPVWDAEDSGDAEQARAHAVAHVLHIPSQSESLQADAKVAQATGLRVWLLIK